MAMGHARTFRAAGTREALAAVCRELGPDAVILSRRKTVDAAGNPLVEVTARARGDYRLQTGLLITAVLIALILLIQAGDAELQVSPLPAQRTPAPPTAIAVLPLVDLSDGERDDRFGEGLAEDLIGSLAQARTLRVVSRSSSFSAAAAATTSREAGRRLGVGLVIEGSFRRADDRTRVVVNLVDVTSGFSRWSGTYERPFADILGLQREIAAAVTGALRREIGGEGLELRENGGTDNLEAHTLYHLARWQMDHRDPDALRAAINSFERAIALDPSYARAQAGLAAAVYLSGAHGLQPAAETLPRARELTDRALATAPWLGDAWAIRAQVRRDADCDWRGAIADFEHALEVMPSSSLAHHWYANVLGDLGRADEAWEHLQQALALEPLSHQVWQDCGSWHLDRDEFDAALDCFRRALELAPEARGSRHLLLLTLLRAGRDNEAMALFTAKEQEREFSRRLNETRDSGGSTAAIRLFIEERGDLLVAYDQARLWMLTDDHTRVPELLEHSWQERSGQIFHLAVEPLFAPLRTDPGFRELCRKMHLPPFSPASPARP